MAKTSPWLLAYVGLCSALALVVLILERNLLRYPDVWTFLLFLALFVVAEQMAVELPNGAWVVYGMVIALPATVLFGPVAGAAIGALGNAIHRTIAMVRRVRSTSLLASFFAVSQFFLCYYLAGVTFHLLAPVPDYALLAPNRWVSWNWLVTGYGRAPFSGLFWPVLGAYLLALLVFKATNALLVDLIYNRLRGFYSAGRFINTLGIESAIHLLTAPLGLLVVLTYPVYGLYSVILSFTTVLIAGYALHRYVQGHQLNRLLHQRADQLTQILQVSETLRTDLDLDLLLNRITQAIRDSLGFNIVLLSLYDEADQLFERKASAGIPAAEFDRLRAQCVPREGITRFLVEEYRFGRCFLVPHGADPPGPDYSYTPPLPQRDGPDAWHPQDLLLVPMVGRQGEMIGVISVDDPADGRRPQPDSLRTLEIFSNQAAQAIENAQLYAEQRQRLISLEEANQRIRQAQEELSRYNRTLEEKVTQRTSELRERSDQLLVALEKAREADRLKSEFLANMSHELRTPLNSIIGFSRVILNGIDGPLTELQRTDLTAIYNSGVHLLGLINDILDLSRMEAGHMELRKEAIDLGPVVRGVLDTCVPLVQGKPLELLAQIPTDIPQAYADPTRVRQIILNLVSNAIKFTDRGAITVSAKPRDGELLISINDTGIGIQPQDLGKVFEPFRQVGRAVERRAAGSGLGLAISKRFVEMHKGQIWVESEPGQGSTFFFTLPAMASTHQPMTAVLPGRGATSTGHTVLVVDDDPDVISLFRRYLEEQGYQIIGATDAVEALRLAWEVHPFAITLDIILPDENGWNVLRTLKEDKSTQDIPVIICSVVQDENTGFSLGASDYLTKPVSQEDLQAALGRLRRPAGRIVVVEDHPETLDWITRILQERGGYQVTPVPTGEEGLEAIQRQEPDLVLLDLLLPGLSGFEVLARLKSDRRTRSTPIIVVTAKELTAEEETSLNGQMDSLLHKGLFQTEDLLADVARVLHEANAQGEERRGSSG